MAWGKPITVQKLYSGRQCFQRWEPLILIIKSILQIRTLYSSYSTFSCNRIRPKLNNYEWKRQTSRLLIFKTRLHDKIIELYLLSNSCLRSFFWSVIILHWLQRENCTISTAHRTAESDLVMFYNKVFQPF